MKRILSLAVTLVATAAIAASAASAADWSSSVGKSVKPTDECAVAPSGSKVSGVTPASGKAWSVFKPASWSDGSSFKGSKGKHARVAPKGFHEGSSFGTAKVAPSCGNGGYFPLPCGRWHYLGPDYPYPWIYISC